MKRTKNERAIENEIENGAKVSLIGPLAAVLIASLPLSILLAVLAKTVLIRLMGVPELDSFRVGSVTLTAETKMGDSIVPFVIFGVLFVAGLAIFHVSKRYGISSGTRYFLITQAILAILAIVPFIFGLGRPLYSVADSPFLLVLLLQAPLMVFYTTLRYLDPLRIIGMKMPEAMGAYFLSAATAFGALGTLTLIRYLLAPAVLQPTVSATIWFVIAASLAVLLAGSIARMSSNFPTVLSLGFAGVSILTLPLLMPPVINQAGQAVWVPEMRLNVWLIVIGFLAGLLVLETYFRVSRGVGPSLVRFIPSIAIAILIVPLRSLYLAPSIPSDDFHFGELFSPFILWQKFGQIPYVDVLLPRGILPNIVPGFLNEYLNQGTASTYQNVMVIVAVTVMSVSHALLRHSIGFPLATSAVFLFGLANNSLEADLLVLSLMFFVLSLVIATVNPLLLGITVVIIGSISILAYPFMGIASTAATVGAVSALAFGSLLGRERREITYSSILFLSAGLTFMLLFISPLGQLLRGAFDYVVNNAGSNSESFGIPLDASLRAYFSIGQIITLIFALGFFVSLWMLWSRRRKCVQPNAGNYSELAIVAVPAILVLILTGKFMGRIEVSEWFYRPAVGSIMILGLVLPGILTLFGTRVEKSLLWPSVALAFVISLVMFSVGQGLLLSSTFGLLGVPKNWVSEPYIERIPRLGLGDGNVEHLASLDQIQSVSAGLVSGEPVLNLSNRNSLYGYFGWSTPMGYLAPYNIESTAAEIRVIKTLEKTVPAYVFVGPGGQLDGVSMTLRNPLLGHWIMDNYLPFDCGETTWAVSKLTYANSGIGDLICADLKLSALEVGSPEVWARGIGAPRDLGSIPESWGKRASSRPPANQAGIPFAIQSESPTDMTFDLGFSTNLDSSGKSKGDLLKLDIFCPTNPTPAASSQTKATVSWGSEPDPNLVHSSTFIIGSGTLVVPLDVYPTWYLGGYLSNALRLTLPSAECGSDWEVAAELWERVSSRS